MQALHRRALARPRGETRTRFGTRARILAAMRSWLALLSATLPVAAQGVVLPIQKAPVVALVAGDVDGDGHTDLLVGTEDHPLQLLRGGPGGQFSMPALLPGEGWKLRALALADFDGDGDLDLIAGGVSALTRLWINDGGGEFVEASGRLPETRLWVTGIAVGDLDGDKDLDVVLSNFAGRDAVYRNDGRGRFVDDSEILPKSFHSSSTVALADLDGDGALDILVGQRPDAAGRGGRNRAARNDGGKFEDVTELWMRSETGHTTGLVVVDLDGDKLPDLVVATRGLKAREPARSTVHRMAPDHHFLGPSTKRFPAGLMIAQAVAAGDLDGDGDLDLVFGNDGPDNVFLNDGDAMFTPSNALPSVVEDTRALLLVDLDGDGDLDVLTGNFEGTVRWFVNGGAGHFGDTSGGPTAVDDRGTATDRPAVNLTAVAAGKYARRAQAKSAVSERTARGAIDLALIFLADHQAEDGRWDTDVFVGGDFGDPACDGAHDVGITSLALLCFLAEGSQPNKGLHAETCARALTFLRRQQGESGWFGDGVANHAIYDHAIATLAIAEAYAMSGDDALRLPIQRALDEIEARRCPDGGFRYEAGERIGDTSVTAWCTYALVAGRDSGLEPRAGAVARSLAFLRSMTDPVTGRCGYTGRGGLSAREAGAETRFPPAETEGMTGAGVFSRILLGDDLVEHEDLRLGLTLLAGSPPRAVGAGFFDPYAWFHAAHALAQAGGDEWVAWRKAMHVAITARQQKSGGLAGSYPPDDPWGGHGGRFATTALATLALQAEYRFAQLVDPRWRRKVR